jgi:acetate kinase
MPEAILSLNAGGDDPTAIARGEVDSIDEIPRLTATDAAGQTIAEESWAVGGRDAVTGRLLDWIELHLGTSSLAAVGHRLVHGGAQFFEPVALTAETIAAIRALTPLAPLHQPRGLAPIDALRRIRPELTQIACFDTAFHHRLQPPVSRYAIPREYECKGIRKYGFHGLSYAYIARRLGEISPHLAARKTVVAHLGSGASLCAMQHGESVDTTMGFSALDGLVMGTRTGALDPGVLLYLMQEEGLSATEIEDMLYHKSGLLGVSGISSDMRALLASTDPRAAEAVDLFAFHVARETAAMANTLGGLEAMIFTGGIGEHASAVRTMICQRLGWLGVEIDASANEQNAERIDTPHSRVEALVMQTNEELTVARQVAEMIS